VAHHFGLRPVHPWLNGNVIAGQENIGKALGLGMVVIIAIAMLIYVAMQRRAAKWLR
jgi:putative spermidine/putrescine transport system permease protein